MTPPLVLIEWEDATLRDLGTWVDNEPIKYEAKMFVQVGFLLSDTDEGVIITSAWSPEKIAPRDQIPAGMIRRKVFLKGAKA
ncbi:hypothetical protein WG922_21675 [Ramlibacter sp. AN1015]|uniref:hypothetical protein n=1 Tax=Ramlibacter sp. AN1015 TaxID=3133428 RepID=UPI0030BB77F9